MFEQETFEVIIARMLERVSHDVDKRDGAIIYDAGAMTAKELQEMYIALDGVILETFPETASRPNLIRRAAEYGVYPYPATHAILKGEFNQDIPIGSRFSLGELNYIAIQRIGVGIYEMRCEEIGSAGNTQFGQLIPIEYINGLQRAELTELLIPGEEEEPTEDFRVRFFLTRNQIPYGGNRDDYKQKIMEIQGVGGVKPHRTPAGGGTVGITIIDSNYQPPSQAVIDEVQTIVDPIPNNGEGLGVAPYGHRVAVKAVETLTVDIAMKLVLNGATLGQVQAEIEDIAEAYLLEQRKAWDKESSLIVRQLQIESRILEVAGVNDVLESTINNVNSNLLLTADQIPVLGTVTLYE
ncbi:baseplate J/gp47 family protein [Metasolibacillus meyeri]|uniref:Baseplate J/gp47 family protein n=1 Tax=Metasolibacillus meyeri TaxID=1071052 RepID=A0AAW9NY81_9BACL|nr:baseplate J/gp47 family protein [Metasolibacillus meyeri]MEC1180356.1 baseplate J/gp47 family protein [Metasolibacillus meyeri]